MLVVKGRVMLWRYLFALVHLSLRSSGAAEPGGGKLVEEGPPGHSAILCS